MNKTVNVHADMKSGMKISDQKQGFFQRAYRAKVLGLSAALIVLVAGTIALEVSGSGFFVASEAETSTTSGNASLVTDSTASGGKAIQFNAPASSGGGTTTPPPPPPTTPPPTTISGFPADYNTGVPQGKSGDTRAKVVNSLSELPAYTGPCVITVAGTVIDGKKITCSPLEVKANNVVIKNSWVLASNAQAITVTDSNRNTLIQDTEVDGQGKDNSAGGISLIGRDGFKLVRVNAHRSGDIVRFDGWGEAHDSWLHDPQCIQDSCHNDIIQSTNANHIVINHNRFDNQHTQTSCILLKADLGPISNVTVKNNLCNGGGYGMYWYDANYKITQGTGEGIHDNRWMRKVGGGYWPNGGYYGPWAPQASSLPSWYNNVWDDNGAAINI